MPLVVILKTVEAKLPPASIQRPLAAIASSRPATGFIGG
jgi:hypothetical protein